MLQCNTEKDKSKLHCRTAGNMHSNVLYGSQFESACYNIGILAGIWPCGIVTILDELYRAESKGQVYGSIHSFIHSNPTHTSDISKNVFSFLLRCEHICMFGLQNSYATTMGAILGSLLRIPLEVD